MMDLVEEIIKLQGFKKKYLILLLAVATKHPNETRHQTALRYILEAEMSKTAEAQDA